MKLDKGKLKKELKQKRRDSFHIETGDNLAILKRLNPNQFDAMVTDPPAGISFMGKEWDGDKGSRDEWIRWLATTMAECMRVLKPGAHALVWAIPRTQHWTMMALENAGFEVRDVVYHLQGMGFPKSHDISKAIDKASGVERAVVGKGLSGKTAIWSEEGNKGMYDITAPATPEAQKWSGWGSALKPACEPWILVQKPLSEPTIAANVLKHGVGGLNIDGCRISTEDDTGRLSGKTSIWASSGDRPNIQSQAHSAGRFPSHVILDEVAAEMLDEQSDGASRYFYTAKASKAEKNYGLEGMPTETVTRFSGGWKDGNSEKEVKNTHPTVKPIALMKYLITLITPPGGTVLDPFMGSGTTGVAAIKNGFKFFGIDQDAQYTEIARKRLFAVYKIDPKTIRTVKR